MQVTDEIYALVPEEYRDKCGINWNAKANKFYVFLKLGYRYDRTKKRSVNLRESLGSIKDGVFTYGPSFAKKQTISKLEKEIDKIKKKDGAKRGRPAKATPSNKNKTNETQSTETKNDKAETQEAKTNETELTTSATVATTQASFPLEIILDTARLASFSGISDDFGMALYWERCRDELSILFDDFPQENISPKLINHLFRIIDPNHLWSLIDDMFTPFDVVNARRLYHVPQKVAKTFDYKAGRYFFKVYEAENHLFLQQLNLKSKEEDVYNGTDVLPALNLSAEDIITADALNIQGSMTKTICDKGANLCLVVNSDYEYLHQKITDLFAKTEDASCKVINATVSNAGCKEEKILKILPASLLANKFSQEWSVALHYGVIVIEHSVTTTKNTANNKTQNKHADTAEETRYFICSIPWDDKDCATRTAELIQHSFPLDDSLMWVLDHNFTQESIKATDRNYLDNRIQLSELALEALESSHKFYRIINGVEISVQMLMLLSATPAGALQIHDKVFDVKRLSSDYKSQR